MNQHIKGKYTAAYFQLVLKEARSAMPLEDDDRFGLGQAIMNVITQSGPTVISKKSSRRDKFIANKIFRPMSEIFTTIWSIENIAVYVRTFPHRAQGISRLSYLRYHVENYLNEIYILQCRLISYLNTLEKAYLKSEQGPKISEIHKPLCTFINDSLKSYNGVRGSHVHVARFSDEEIDRLSTLELMSMGNDDFGNLMKSIFLRSYSATRKKWADKILKDSMEINKILEVYFEILSKLLFKGERLIVPDNHK